MIVTPVTGKWEFVSSYGTAGMQTPATTNITERYEFGSDSTASIYFNNKFSSRVNYSFTKDFKYTDYRSTQTFDRVKIDAASYKATIKNDTLHLDTYDMYDPSYSIFVRIK